MNNPFLPPSFTPGPPTAPVWESGPLPYVAYNGQNQTSKINTAKPKPPTELGPGPADPNISAHRREYTGSGYGPIGQGTIGVGNIVTVGAQFPPAQVRFYLSGGNLYAVDSRSGLAFFLSPSGVAPVPSNYTPTK